MNNFGLESSFNVQSELEQAANRADIIVMVCSACIFIILKYMGVL
jgi:hypothetical protein